MIGAHFKFEDITRWLTALARVESSAMAEAQKNPYLNSVDFCNLLRRNITTQRFAPSYAPLNPRYRIWKQQYGRSGREFWALFGDLLANIQPTKIGVGRNRPKGWLGGVVPGSKDSGGKSWLGKGDRGRSMDISKYGTWAERGRQGQPARPLIGPSTDMYEVDGFRRRGRESYLRVTGNWR